MMIGDRHIDSACGQTLNQPRCEEHRGTGNENSHDAKDVRRVIDDFVTVNG